MEAGKNENYLLKMGDTTRNIEKQSSRQEKSATGISMIQMVRKGKVNTELGYKIARRL